MKSLLLSLSLIIVCGAATHVQACSCDLDVFTPENKRVAKAKRTADAVFVGKLVKLTEPRNEDGSLTGNVIAEFEVERAWAGVKSSTVTVYTTNICCICGYPFAEGGKYIVYASGKEKLSTTICTRTSPIGEVSSDEKYLGTPVIFEKKRTPLEPIS